MLFLYVFWQLRFCFKNNYESLKLNLVLSVVVVQFMVYPSLITIFFDLFNCYEIEHGETWLTNDLQLRCWGQDHLFWALLIGVPSFLLWIVGIPFVGFRALRMRQNNLDDPITLAQFKVMYQGLKPEFYYWEFVTLIRKLLLISINVFLGSVDSFFQVRILHP